MEGVFYALSRGLHESRDLHGAGLEVFAAAPVLAVDRWTIECPQIAARVEFGQDEHVGDRRIVEIGQLLLWEVYFRRACPEPVPLRDGFGEERFAVFAGEFVVASDRPLVRQFDPEGLGAVRVNDNPHIEGQSVACRSYRGASRVCHQGDVFSSAILQHCADNMSGQVPLSPAQLEDGRLLGRSIVAKGQPDYVKCLRARICGWDLASLRVRIDGKCEFFQCNVAIARGGNNERIASAIEPLIAHSKGLHDRDRAAAVRVSAVASRIVCASRKFVNIRLDRELAIQLVAEADGCVEWLALQAPLRPFQVALLVDDGFVAAHRQADEALRVGVRVAMVDGDLRGERDRADEKRESRRESSSDESHWALMVERTRISPG